MTEEELVTIEEVSKALNIPRHVIYRRMRDRKHPLPFVDKTEPYHARRQYRFQISEVRAYFAALGMRPE